MMQKRLIAPLVFSMAVVSPLLLADGWWSTSLHKKVDLTLSEKAVSSFYIDAGAGDLEVIGQEDLSDIIVEAHIYGEEVNAEDYQLSLEKKGDKGVLIAMFMGNTYNNERIDVKVRMPKNLALLVDDRSGDVVIESIDAGLTLRDRSGDIHLANIAGGLIVDDRSGDIVAEAVAGDSKITDRSGDIELEEVDGDLDIEDSSGDIRGKNISGVVTVEDSSGDININGAADFKIKRDGSGDVTLKNIQTDNQ